MAWENIHVIEAADADAALVLAGEIGRLREYDDCTLREVTPDGEYPLRRVFAGVRKVLTVSHQGDEDRVGSGDEVSFSEYLLDSEEAVQRLASGETIDLTYTDR